MLRLVVTAGLWLFVAVMLGQAWSYEPLIAIAIVVGGLVGGLVIAIVRTGIERERGARQP